MSLKSIENQEGYTRFWDLVVSGSVDVGSRQPTAFPCWVSLKVLNGGFATDIPLSPLLQNELPNQYYLLTEGVQLLLDSYAKGTYNIEFPEQGALMVVALLNDMGQKGLADEIVKAITPFFDQIKFFPQFTQVSKFEDIKNKVPHTAIENCQMVRERIEKSIPFKERNALNICTKDARRWLARKEAKETWRPFRLAITECLHNWLVAYNLPNNEKNEKLDKQRLEAIELLIQYESLSRNQAQADSEYKKNSTFNKPGVLNSKHLKKGGHFYISIQILKIIAEGQNKLTNGQLKFLENLKILAQQKDIKPHSTDVKSSVDRQLVYINSLKLALSIIKDYEVDTIEDADVEKLLKKVSETLDFSNKSSSQFSKKIVELIAKKVRCFTLQPFEKLRYLNLERLSKFALPDLINRVLAQSATPELSHLEYSIRMAWERRKSLLLTGLASQVRITELPWFSGLKFVNFNNKSLEGNEVVSARDNDELNLYKIKIRSFFEEFVKELIAFVPASPFPNNLISQFRELAKASGINDPDRKHYGLQVCPLLASDIFERKFSAPFLEAAIRAASLLKDSIYSIYYGFNAIYNVILSDGFNEKDLYKICDPGSYYKKRLYNEALIERFNMLIARNLAALVVTFDLKEKLNWVEIAKTAITNVQKNSDFRIEYFLFSLSMLRKGNIGEIVNDLRQREPNEWIKQYFPENTVFTEVELMYIQKIHSHLNVMIAENYLLSKAGSKL